MPNSNLIQITYILSYSGRIWLQSLNKLFLNTSVIWLKSLQKELRSISVNTELNLG